MSEAKKPDRKHFLDGIRGWGSVMVFFSHTLLFFMIGVTPEYFSQWVMFPSDGMMALYIFFILSGFALSTGYFHSHDLRVIAALAIRRYPRLIIPIFCATLLAYVLMKTGLMFNMQAAPLLKSEWVGSMFNFEPTLESMLSFGLFDVFFNFYYSTKYNPILWTMPIEFYGSLTVFLTVVVAHYVRQRFYIYCAVLAVVVGMKSMMIPFVFGIMMADIYERRKFQQFRQTKRALFAALPLIAIGVYATINWRGVYEDPRLISLMALCLVAAPVMSAHVAKFFENRLSQFLGRISFPLFITHLIVLFSFSSWLVIKLHDSGVEPSFMVSNTIVFASFVMAILLAMLFEPIEHFAIHSARKISNWLMWPDKKKPSEQP